MHGALEEKICFKNSQSNFFGLCHTWEWGTGEAHSWFSQNFVSMFRNKITIWVLLKKNPDFDFKNTFVCNFLIFKF